MKKALFILRALLYFRLRKKGSAVALVVNEFTETEAGNKAYARYSELRQDGRKVFVLSAFNNAPLGVHLDDYRDIYIFENDAEKLMCFCAEKGVGELHYYDCDVLFAFLSRMGLDVHRG